ncbi:MAG: hypothetical protein BME94_06480 [Methanobacteriales archaeon Met13]
MFFKPRQCPSPVYMYHITALMKNFIDHFAYLVHRPKYFKKPAMVFIHRGGMFKEVIAYMERVAKSWGFSVVAKLGIADLDDLTPNYREKSIKELQRETEKFYNAVKTGKLPSPTLTDLIGFRVWKINDRNLKSEFPADHAYWEENGLFEKNYITMPI